MGSEGEARPALLAIENVSISVGRRRLLAGVSIHLRAGELVGISGPSGSGKTELLRAISGLRDADTGSFALDGRDRSTMAFPAWRRRVTHVGQKAVMLEGSVRDNLARPARYASVGSAPDDSELLDLLGRLGLPGDVLGRRARTLSVGEQQRVALVRALCIHPSVLLLDEPTSALDHDAMQSVEELVSARADSAGLAALVVSHDPAQLSRWTVRQIEVRDFQVQDA